jgi:hypothetical protein
MLHSPTIRRTDRAPTILAATHTETNGTAQLPCVSEGEQGYMLLVAVFFLALMVISLSVAMPAVIKSIQRDHDLETFQRGKQYRRAIQLYYRKFHAYPPNVDALVNTNQIKFLRKKYTDPITGKEDWKPVLFGQNKTPTAMGFFGQPLSGNASTIAGIGPSGGAGMAGLPGITPLGGTSTSGFGSSSSSGSSIFSSSSTDNSGNSSGASGSTDNSGGTNSAGSATGSNGSSSSGSNSSGSSSDQSSGQTFGGAGIIGFSPGSSKQSILVYKKKNHYNEWEFTYDPISDMQMMGGGNTGMIGQPASSTTNPVGSSPFGGSPFGNSPSGSSGLGGTGPGTSGSSGSGSSPTSP